ncbi:group 1 family glycosyl transferase [Motiliproteus sp. MSK22-1]|nr:group 1 family glycosyl transferase [Motiliproteus sp. MSK22-1]
MSKEPQEKESLVILTNLFPLPWEPNRATFNRQQFQLLEDSYDLAILIPVAFADWFKHRKEIRQTASRRYIPYWYIPKTGRRFYSLFMFLSVLMHSGGWLFRRKPKVILSSWAYPEGVAGAWLSRLLGARFYLKVHGSDINLHGQIPSRARQIVAAAKHASGVVTVSKALAKQLCGMGVDEQKVQTIYNGVDHDKFGLEVNSSEEDPPYILFVGNLKKEKGVVELLEGFAGIAEQYPALRLVYAGEGVMASELLQGAKEKSLGDRVELLGTVDHSQLPALMAKAKAVALPSYNEGVPNVVLEAMACGIPVLATKVGGIPEVMVEGVTGVLVRERDAVEVERGLSELLDQAWDRQKICANASRFSWSVNREQLLALLRR